MSDTTFIYVLIDPRDNQIRYVGKANDINKRFKAHLQKCRLISHTHKVLWIQKLKELSLVPILKIIEECSTEQWEEREIFWIKYYRELGCDLTNATIGGDGQRSGTKFSDETKMKMSKSRKGRIITDETRLKLSLAKRGENHHLWGKHLSDETKRKLSVANGGEKNGHFGKLQTEECKKKISLANSGEKHWSFGKPFTMEHRNNISLALSGKSHTSEHRNNLSLAGLGYKSKDSTSKYMGVCFNDKTNKWRSSVYYDKKQKHVGNFIDEIDAAKARDRYVIENDLPLKLNFEVQI